MQSSGGLTDAHRSRARTRSCRGPRAASSARSRCRGSPGFDRIIGFDMGGTSTDVTHCAGEYERAFVTEVAGVRLRAPMMSIHTVAAGGGSICTFDGARFRVGPESAGANPGPAAYRRGGPLTVTDCNVMVGKLDPDLFPTVFGPAATSRSTRRSCARSSPRSRPTSPRRPAWRGRRRRSPRASSRSPSRTWRNAIKHISVQRGYDVTEYTLCCFGGAGGQHACLVADALGMTRVFIHPLAGVLSAYGMGLADVRALRQQAVEATLVAGSARRGRPTRSRARRRRRAPRSRAGHRRRRASTCRRTLHLKYDGTDTTLEIPRRARRSRPIVARVRAPLPAAVRLPDAGQGAGRSRRSRSRRSAATQSAADESRRRSRRARARCAPIEGQPHLHGRRVSRRARVRPRRPAARAMRSPGPRSSASRTRRR